MVFVPLVHGANRLVRWVSSFEGIMPFRSHETEHPHINYQNMPVRGLYELRRMADELVPRLPDINCPSRVIQGSDDPVVDAKSAELIRNGVTRARSELLTVPSKRHGIVYENIGGTQAAILEFVESLR